MFYWMGVVIVNVINMIWMRLFISADFRNEKKIIVIQNISIYKDMELR